MRWNAWIRGCAVLGLGGASLMGWRVQLPGGLLACGASFCFGVLSLGAVIFRWEPFFQALGLGRVEGQPARKDLLLTTTLGLWCVVVAVLATVRVEP